jgi:hypothetical protein
MSTIDRFEDLEAWKLGRQLTRLIYSASGTGNFGRDFALRDQIRRASISIVSNIAEGFERDGDKRSDNSCDSAKSNYRWTDPLSSAIGVFREEIQNSTSMKV